VAENRQLTYYSYYSRRNAKRTIIKSATAQRSKKMKNVAVRWQKVNVRRQEVQHPEMKMRVSISRDDATQGKARTQDPKCQRISEIIPT